MTDKYIRPKVLAEQRTNLVRRQRIRASYTSTIRTKGADMSICKYNQDAVTCPKDPMNCQCLLDATMTDKYIRPEGLTDKGEK
jgi:hypothetical protein